MATEYYQIFYKYHNNNDRNTNHLKFINLNEVLTHLTKESNYQDLEGRQYYVSLEKNGEAWYPMSPVCKLIEEVIYNIKNGTQSPIQYSKDNITMAAKTGFEYTVILHALPVKDNSGNDVTPDSEIIIKPTTVVAVDANHVTRIASRKIATTVSDSDLGRVEIKVRNL